MNSTGGNQTIPNNSGKNWCEIVLLTEIVYQCLFFLVGTPINIWRLQRDIRQLRGYATSRAVSPISAPRLYYLTINLTIANLIILCVHCVTKTGWLLTYFWYGGNVLCKLYSFFSTFGYYLFSNCVVVIALDMLYSMKNPLRNISHGIKRVRTWLVIVWLLALVCAVPQLVLFGTYLVPKEYSRSLGKPVYQCINLYVYRENLVLFYGLYHSLSIFYVPLTLILGSYAGIIYYVIRSLRTRRALSCDFGAPGDEASNQYLLVPSAAAPSTANFSNSGQGSSIRRSGSSKTTRFSSQNSRCPSPASQSRASSSRTVRKVVKARSARTKKKLLLSSLSVILAYIFCWLPYQAVSSWRLLCEIFRSLTCADVSCRLEWLEGIMILSALLNPFLYRFGTSEVSARKRKKRQHNLSVRNVSGVENGARRLSRQNCVRIKNGNAVVECSKLHENIIPHSSPKNKGLYSPKDRNDILDASVNMTTFL